MKTELEASRNRGNRDLSPDGKCVVQDDGFYLCTGMTAWLNGSCVNEKGRNYLRLTASFDSGKEQYRGIVAHIPRHKGGGIHINFCPFCGSDRVLNYPVEE